MENPISCLIEITFGNARQLSKYWRVGIHAKSTAGYIKCSRFSLSMRNRVLHPWRNFSTIGPATLIRILAKHETFYCCRLGIWVFTNSVKKSTVQKAISYYHYISFSLSIEMNIGFRKYISTLLDPPMVCKWQRRFWAALARLKYIQGVCVEKGHFIGPVHQGRFIGGPVHQRPIHR